MAIYQKMIFLAMFIFSLFLYSGEGIVNILTNIQTQVKCLSNLVNSVRLRMVQDMNTKEYEVETGKMDELVVFARSMGKSCAILSNQVSSLNILLVSLLNYFFIASQIFIILKNSHLGNVLMQY